jgi:hypothetical protein
MLGKLFQINPMRQGVALSEPSGESTGVYNEGMRSQVSKSVVIGGFHSAAQNARRASACSVFSAGLFA